MPDLFLEFREVLVAVNAELWEKMTSGSRWNDGGAGSASFGVDKNHRSKVMSRVVETEENSIDAGQIAVRLNDLDITRATEQTALLLSLTMGRGVETHETPAMSSKGGKVPRTRGENQKLHGLRPATIEEWALRSMLGYLKDSYCQGSIAFTDPSDTKGQLKKNLWTALGQSFGREDAGAAGAAMQLEFVVRAIDGAADLRVGSGGAIAAIAGGPPNSFVKPAADKYFVMAVNPTLADGVRDFDRTIQNKRRVISLAEIVIPLAKRIHEIAATKNLPEFAISSMTHASGKPFRSIQSKLSKNCRIRTFTGSPIAAALATFLRRFSNDVFADEMDKTQIALMAVAACATGSDFFAVPIKKVKNSAKGKTLTTDAMDYLSLSDFVREATSTADVFLILTAITDSLALPGVRFHDNRSVSTDTMCLRTRTRSIRSITHRHGLGKKRFRLIPKSPTKKTIDISDWEEVLQEFRQMLGDE